MASGYSGIWTACSYVLPPTSRPFGTCQTSMLTLRSHGELWQELPNIETDFTVNWPTLCLADINGHISFNYPSCREVTAPGKDARRDFVKLVIGLRLDPQPGHLCLWDWPFRGEAQTEDSCLAVLETELDKSPWYMSLGRCFADGVHLIYYIWTIPKIPNFHQGLLESCESPSKLSVFGMSQHHLSGIS